MSHEAELGGPDGKADRVLSLWLRQHSAADHLWLEDQVGPTQAAMSRVRYAKMLLMFRALHALNIALHEVFATACETYGFSPPRRYEAAIVDDLAALGLSMTDGTLGAISIDLYPSFADALGALYVAEGSALGNVLVLRQSESWVDLPPSSARQFLGESANNAGHRFQSFRSSLDAFGLAKPEFREVVLGSTRRTFRACGNLINSLD
jgi:heme oxygenase